jgi:HAD superfamily hydrolase (TIGR01549 family)
MPNQPALLFDLDGTLVDNNYEHVLAWREAFGTEGIDVRAWRLHRKIGMSGDLLTRAIARELHVDLTPERQQRLETAHGAAYRRLATHVGPMRGARDLLETLDRLGVPWAIGTNSREEDARPEIASLRIIGEHPIITRDAVDDAKPSPDLFAEAARRLGVDVADAIVVGDSVWDLLAAQRARALGVGLLSGGSGREELAGAGAYRVYEDVAELLQHLDELGVHDT